MSWGMSAKWMNPKWNPIERHILSDILLPRILTVQIRWVIISWHAVSWFNQQFNLSFKQIRSDFTLQLLKKHFYWYFLLLHFYCYKQSIKMFLHPSSQPNIKVYNFFYNHRKDILNLNNIPLLCQMIIWWLRKWLDNYTGHSYKGVHTT